MKRFSVGLFVTVILSGTTVFAGGDANKGCPPKGKVSGQVFGNEGNRTAINGGGIGRVEFVRGNEGNRAAVDGAGTNSLARDGGTNGKSVSGGGGGGIGN